MSFSKLGRGRPIRSQTMEVVINVNKYFEEEKLREGPSCSYFKVRQRVHEATGIGLARVNSICRDFDKAVVRGTAFPPETPGKQRIRKCPISHPDSFMLQAIRRKVHQFYLKGELPTLRKLVKALNTPESEDEPPIFSGCKETLRVLLTKHLGFKFRTVDRRKHLLERTDVVALRHEYLRQIRKVDLQNVVFLDETWVNENHTVSKCWQAPECNSIHVPLGKGKRLILLHAGSSKGFVDNGLLLFPSKSGKADYHDDMNAECFTQWFKCQLLPNIPPHSIIVMDNAPYHSVQLDKAPVSNNRKQVMQDWLTANNISFDGGMLKAELYEFIKLHKPRTKKYVIDELAAEAPYFNKIIRLPPYHCEFNPIEMIWSDVKQYVAKRNTSYKLSAVENLTKEAVASVTAEAWRKKVEHVRKLIEEFWVKDSLIECAIEPFIISIGQDSSSESNDSSREVTDDDFEKSFEPVMYDE